MQEHATPLADEELFERRIANLDALADELEQPDHTSCDDDLADDDLAELSEAELIARRRAHSLAQAARLVEEAERLEARRALTRLQRRRIAQWIQAERNALQQQRETFEHESKRALQQLKRERAKCSKEREEFEELRCNLEANLENGSAVDPAELAQLQSDRSLLNSRVQQLEHQLAETEQRLATRSTDELDPNQLDELQRRFEMAIDDVRELKHRNAELEEALAESQTAEQASGGRQQGEDWEATKRRLMSNLDTDGENSLTAADRLTVEGAIRITDDIVAQRDQEIADLRRQIDLGQPSAGEPEASAPGGAATPASELLFNQDDVICQERERLAAVKQELREKLRQAEVEFSVQRAGVARERAELQEKIRAMESEKDSLVAQQNRAAGTTNDKSKKQPTRRWLERMGLKEQDQE